MGVLLSGGHPGDGPSWYRVELPCRWLRTRGHDVRTIYGMVSEERGDLKNVTTYMTQRGYEPMLVLAIEVLHRRGIRTLYELDDDVWNIPAYNPLGKHFTEQHINGMENAMRLVDEVVVTTPYLGHIVSKYNSNVRVIRNGVPLDMVPKLPRTKADIRIGWHGSSTHHGDLSVVMPVLRNVLRSHSNVTAVFMGSMPAGWRTGPQVEFHQWVEPEKLYDKLAQLELDIALAPLSHHVFNRSKSDVKLVENAVVGVPVVASDFGPYRVVRDGETGLKISGNSPRAWRDAIETMIAEPERRRLMGKEARRWALAHASMDAVGGEWEKAFHLSSTVVSVNERTEIQERVTA